MEENSRPSLKMRFASYLNWLKSKRKPIIGVLGVLVLTVSLASGVYLVQKRQSTKTEASGVDLSLTSSNNNPRVNDNIVVAVGIDTKGLSVSAMDLKIRYDTAKLQLVGSVQTGDFLPTVLKPSADTNGLITTTLACLIDENGAHPRSGTGAIAQITFLAKAAGTTQISFDTGTQVAAIGQSSNVIETSNPLSVVISQTGGSTLGDITGEGDVNLLDINVIINYYDRPASDYPSADLDNSGTIGLLDLNIVIANYE